MMLLTPPTVVHPKKSPEAYKENEEVSTVVASQPSISENLTSRYASLQNLTAEEKKARQRERVRISYFRRKHRERGIESTPENLTRRYASLKDFTEEEKKARKAEQKRISYLRRKHCKQGIKSTPENLARKRRYVSLKGLTEEDKEEKTQQFGSFDSSQAAIATELMQDTTAPSYRLQDYFVTEASPSSMPDSVSVIEPQAGQENSYQKNQP